MAQILLQLSSPPLCSIDRHTSNLQPNRSCPACQLLSDQHVNAAPPRQLLQWRLKQQPLPHRFPATPPSAEPLAVRLPGDCISRPSSSSLANSGSGMANQLKEDKKNEQIIRGLLKL